MEIAAGVSEGEMQTSKKAAPEEEEGEITINQLMAQLHSHDFKRRESARWQLVALRELAVFPLIDALEDPDWHVRWEAAKALHDIADSASSAGARSGSER